MCFGHATQFTEASKQATRCVQYVCVCVCVRHSLGVQVPTHTRSALWFQRFTTGNENVGRRTSEKVNELGKDKKKTRKTQNFRDRRFLLCRTGDL